MVMQRDATLEKGTRAVFPGNANYNLSYIFVRLVLG